MVLKDLNLPKKTTIHLISTDASTANGTSRSSTTTATTTSSRYEKKDFLTRIDKLSLLVDLIAVHYLQPNMPAVVSLLVFQSRCFMKTNLASALHLNLFCQLVQPFLTYVCSFLCATINEYV